MKAIAIIPAAGQGLRMQTAVEKPYIRIGDRPVLAHTLDVMDQCPLIDGYVLVVEPSKQAACRREIVDEFGYKRVLDIVAGGATRQESVYRGLMALDANVEAVLIHDAARPCVTPELIEASITRCRRDGAVLVAAPVKDTIKVVSDGVVKSTPDRSTLWLAQTPQTFSYALLRDAHEKALASDFTGTDDAALVERAGHAVHILQGDYDNIKITTPEDLDAAERILRRQGRI